MWSIGAVATALLTGDVIFTDRLNPMMQKDPAKVILEISSKCDLSILDNGYSAWRAVGKRPKEFVRSLLVVDESKRLDVKQALAHDWFTNKHCDGAFNAVYQKAVKDWQPRRKHVRVVEALDLGRLPPRIKYVDTMRPQYFSPLAVPFPQGEMYPKNIPSLTKAGPPVLPTIGEEDTSEPSTPDPLTPDAPMAPKAKKPSRAATAFDVQYSLIQLDIDTAVTPSEASADIAMTDREQPDEYDSYDIDAPVVPINIVQNPSQDLFAAEVIRETPPSMRKRPRESDSQMDDDTYDSSLEIVGKRFDRPVSANMWKKTRLR
jgi:serine/threonine protein kinase